MEFIDFKNRLGSHLSLNMNNYDEDTELQDIPEYDSLMSLDIQVFLEELAGRQLDDVQGHDTLGKLKSYL
jgi:acyl carrier protein